MSKYIDINQLLGEIKTSARSAGDPWRLSRSDHGVVKKDPFNPSVVADLGAAWPEVGAAIQSSQRVAQANTAAGESTGSPEEDGGMPGTGFFGRLLSFFPFASGITKLFGLGDDSLPPAPTAYQLPPSISFEGAMSGVASGVTKLSYGPDGLPRVPSSIRAEGGTIASDFTASPAEAIHEMSGRYSSGPGSMSTGLDSVGGDTTALFGRAFRSEPSESTTIADFSRRTAGLNSVGLAGGSNSDGGTGVSRSNNQPAAGQTGQSVLVQVQAMDSQSFMDHSQEIAQAVRQAMLNSNSLNDVILEL